MTNTRKEEMKYLRELLGKEADLQLKIEKASLAIRRLDKKVNTYGVINEAITAKRKENELELKAIRKQLVKVKKELGL